MLEIVHQNVTLLSATYSGGQFIVEASYGGDVLGGFDIVLDVSGSALQNATVTMYRVEYAPPLPAVHYSEEECEALEKVGRYLDVLLIGGYAIMLLGFLNCKIVGLELTGVFQLAYLDVSTQEFLTIYSQSLSSLNWVNGFALDLIPEDTAVPPLLGEIGASPLFTNNFNVVYACMVGLMVILLVLMIVSHLSNYARTYTRAKAIFKEGFVTFVMFSTLNVSFSAGVDWKYASGSEAHYILN